MSIEAEKLLDAERAVQDVLRAASALRDEAAKHGSAHSALAETRQDLGRLAQELSACASSLTGTIGAINAAGTPQILARIQELTELSRQGTERVLVTLTESEASVKSSVESSITSLSTQVSETSEMATAGLAAATASHHQVRRVSGQVKVLLALVLIACLGSIGSAIGLLLQVPQVHAFFFG